MAAYLVAKNIIRNAKVGALVQAPDSDQIPAAGMPIESEVERDVTAGIVEVSRINRI